MKRPLMLMLMLMLIATQVPAAGLAEEQRRRKASPSTITVEATAYCVEGETATGEQTRRGIVAADPAVLPLGSVIRVQGLPGRRHNRTYRVEDTGRSVKGRIIDIFMPDCAAAKAFGRQTARVRILERGGNAP